MSVVMRCGIREAARGSGAVAEEAGVSIPLLFPLSGMEGEHIEALLQGPLTPVVGDRTPACVLESERDRGGGECGE